jgi:hypothetical protein
MLFVVVLFSCYQLLHVIFIYSMCKLSICIVMLKVPCVAFHSYTFYPAHNISDCLSEVDSPYLFVFLGFNLQCFLLGDNRPFDIYHQINMLR